MLKEQDAPEAQELALRMEIYTAGSYDMFAQSTNVDTQAHIIDYDLSKLGEGMNAVGMLIVLESIYSRLMRIYPVWRYLMGSMCIRAT